MSKAYRGAKPLSGGSSLTSRSIPSLNQIINTVISTGGSLYSNIAITGGTIDGVIIGENQAGPGYFTSLDVGKNDGTGGQVCFYGNTVGDHACWINTTGTWDIEGDLSVRDISDLGNLRISVNTISSNNTNGNVNLVSNGSGIINLSGGLTQTTVNGNITLNTTTGNYALNSNRYITSTSGNYSSVTSNGSISFSTGIIPVTYVISSISTGSSPVFTTSSIHNLEIGDKVIISSTNSIPNVNGVYTVSTTPSANSFTISSNPVVTVSGNSGQVVKRNDINLNALDSIFIPGDTPLSFGNDSNYLLGNLTDLNIGSGNDINLIPINNINIPNSKLLTFGNDTVNITSDGTDLFLNTGNDVIVNGNFTVNGEMTYLKTTVTSLDDPVITLGGTSPPVTGDIKDRGVEIRYFEGSAKVGYFGKNTNTGCFTWIPDAINTNEVFTGLPGCVQFGEILGTSLDLSGGNITNTGSINTCDITCNDDLIITGTNSITLDAININLSDSLFNIGTTDITDTKDKGFSFNYYSGSAKLGFIGLDSSEDCFKFLKDVTIVNNQVTSGTEGDVCLGNTAVNNLTVNGFISGGNSPERLSLTGGSNGSPSESIPTTYISVTSAGIATGILPVGTHDGFEKKIFLVSTVTGGTYELGCPTGRLVDPGSGTSNTKTLKFENRGQSVHLSWDAIQSTYFVVNAGVCVV